MKIYRGARTFDGLEVTVDGRPLPQRFDLKTYSKNGFEWSYEGAEASQLALALLADATDDRTALAMCDPFMRAIVANFDNDWEITEEQLRVALRALEQT